MSSLDTEQKAFEEQYMTFGEIMRLHSPDKSMLHEDQESRANGQSNIYTARTGADLEKLEPDSGNHHHLKTQRLELHMPYRNTYLDEQQIEHKQKLAEM